MTSEQKEQRIAEIRAGIVKAEIKGENGEDGVSLSYVLSDGRTVGVNVWGWGINSEMAMDSCFNKVAHSVLYHEEMAEGGAA